MRPRVFLYSSTYRPPCRSQEKSQLMPFTTMRLHCVGAAYRSSAAFKARSNASGLKSSKTMPVPSPVPGLKCSTESASPPVLRTTGTVP